MSDRENECVMKCFIIISQLFVCLVCVQLFIDFLARLMCMRSGLVPDDYDKRQAMHNADGVHFIKDGKHKKKFKCPEMKYNKFQMYDLKEAASAALSNHAGPGAMPPGPGQSEATSPDKSPVHLHQSVESDVREIRRYLRQLLGRLHQKEEKARIALEWRIVALVLDRLFFFMYLAAIIISLATIFPKTY